MKRAELKESLERMLAQLNHGCGNHGCQINSPKGQGTNGSCSCRPRDFSKRMISIGELLSAHGYNNFDSQ